MSLYTKTVVIVGGLLVALTVILYVLSQSVLLASYAEMERQDTQQHLRRALNLLREETENLKRQTTDYANWDDSYAFVQDVNQQYIDDNLYDEIISNLQINLILFVNPEGEVVYGKALDFEAAAEIPLPDGLDSLLNDQLLKNGSASGVVMLPEGAILVSAEPILTSLMEGPSAGTLMMGRFLDEAKIQSFSEALELDLTFQPYNSPTLPPDFETAKASLGQAAFIQPLNADQVAGYALVNDIDQQPALLMRITMPRSIYAQGEASLSYFLRARLLTAVIVIAVMFVFLDLLVLSRMANLSRQVIAAGSPGAAPTRIELPGKDELARLARTINQTFESLARTQAKLQQSNSDLLAEISDHKQTQAKLALARDQALEAVNFKEQILANVSHDARTPLNVINLRIEMLKSGRYGVLNSAQLETLDSITLSARQLLGFVTNLLSEAQIKASTLKIQPRQMRPTQLFEEVTANIAPLAERKGLAFSANLSPDLPDEVMGDPERLSQILMNLADNAIKFTETGFVRLYAGRADDSHWTLQVSDSGGGIPEAAQARVFEAFWQVDGSSTRETGYGVGLGLSIVKQIVTLMNGTISLHSETGKGSTFTITLPLNRVESEYVDETTVHPHH